MEAKLQCTIRSRRRIDVCGFSRCTGLVHCDSASSMHPTKAFAGRTATIRSNAASLLLLFDDMQTAFFLRRALPAAGAFVFTAFDRFRAGPATDAGISLI